MRTGAWRNGFGLWLAVGLGLVGFGRREAVAASGDVDPVHASLITAVTSVQPGQRFDVGIRLELAPGWHTYWRNPGDVGFPCAVKWALPDGLSAGPLRWPYPEKIIGPSTSSEGPPEVTYGYDGEVTLLVQLSVAATVTAKTLPIQAEVSWLACEDMCIPGGATVRMSLPLSQGAPGVDATAAALLADAARRVPVPAPEGTVAARVDGDSAVFDVSFPDGVAAAPERALFVPDKPGVVRDTADQTVTTEGAGFRLRVRLPAGSVPSRLAGVLIVHEAPGKEARAVSVDVPLSAGGGPAGSGEAPAVGAVHNVWLALLFSFLGGMILNLMPCVLPVLSLKIFGFVKQAEEQGVSPLVHGLVFTGGVVVCFWALAGVLLALRAGGQALGWGFQLQSPPFVLGLCAFFLLFALSMFGVFEIGTSLIGVGSGSDRAGLAGSFFSGVIATIIATPCTAPFMGTALGFALTQPVWAAMLIFSMLGFGMATPYVILSAFPALLRFVPKPGAWMESFKQFLGFLLLATVCWLLWVFGGQAGNNALGFALLGLTVVAMAAWVVGRWASPIRSARVRAGARAGALVLLAGGLLLASRGLGERENQDEAIAWEAFSPATLAGHLAAGQPVFLDFTADWCLTCKVNDGVAFTADVAKRLKALGVVPMKGDWTNRDASITEAMAGYGRSGVPLYVLYDRQGTYTILPQLLTPATILEALDGLVPAP